MAYVQSDEGKKDCKELFPNDTQQNICRTAALFLDHYVKWTGEGSGNKYNELANKKLKHSKETKNYGHYVKKAAESLKNQADMVDRVLPQAQLPTSNNDVSNFSLSHCNCWCLDLTLFLTPKTLRYLYFPSIILACRSRCVTTNWIDSSSYCISQS